MTILSNDTLRVEVSAHGAELQSIRKGDVEYLWQGDSRYWGRRSPVLFPIVGSVWESKYRVDGTEYKLGQHGFARDMDFTLVSASQTEVRYRLESSEETLAKYPYPFVLEIAYRLHGGCVDVIWEVSNPSDKEMFFQIGAHPAFFYPDYDPDASGRGFFTFDCTEGIECIRIKEKGCVDAQTKWPLEMLEGRLKLEKDTFDAIDTIMIQDSQISRVNMFREDGSPWLSLSFDAPVVGIWSPPGKVAPFICIEPWYGRCDRAGYEGEYRDKDWTNRLMPGERFMSVYTIEIA
ncbi:MAG: aldose 1-epimerase family protein [Bacteroidales bacterium]|nr:aldose 1-epimerase family protein [Bacteroidales bacterium]